MNKSAFLYRKSEGGAVNCILCAHRCVIADGGAGICRVRKNIAGELITAAYGEVASAGCDPVEKKPLYHFLPGTLSYSVAAAGCNFRCGFCQNWQISMPDGETSLYGLRKMLPEEIVQSALESGAASVSYTYTEPTIFFEYAYDTARLSAEKGLKNIFVTNGFMTGEALRLIKPFLDAANVDLKFFSDKAYSALCGGRLEPVLDTITLMNELGIWVEITTLIIPGLNDSDDELTGIAEFIAGLDTRIPWHISRFFPQYRYSSCAPTPVSTMQKARIIGEKAGLKYVYPGNLTGKSSTICPRCGAALILRDGYTLLENRITGKNTCPVCSADADVLM